MANREVFCLTDSNGKLLDPALQATALAKYSRSPLSAHELLAALTAEEADKFQDKWVISYSHSSVAELASIPICLEGVSIVASKFLENYPRMGYSEKSTRYQVFSGESFVTPPGAPEGMKEFAAQFYAAYDRLYPQVLARVAELTGLPETDRTVKARTFDNVRYLLPAGTGTNLAMVGNLRDIRYLIQDARGHENQEVREIAEDVFRAASEVCPVLVARAEPNTFEPPVRGLGPVNYLYVPEKPDWYVDQYAALGNPYLNLDYFKFLVRNMHHMSWEEFSSHMEQRGKRAVPKVFRNVRMNFDILMDYGAFRDLQRHRRCEQYVELLTTNYGYLVPDDIVGTSMEADYRQTMELARGYQPTLDPHLRQYVIPLGYLHRSVFEMDLAEVYYLTELRTQPQGHISYRRVAYRMFEVANREYPELMQWCRALKPDSIGAHT